MADDSGDNEERRQVPIEVDVTLSRPACRAGGTIAGTVRIAAAGGDDERRRRHLRGRLSSVRFAAVGYCRLDPRWHSPAALEQHRRGRRQRRQSSEAVAAAPAPSDLPLPLPGTAHTAPFWASDCAELLGLRERQTGSWEEARPKPIRLHHRAAVGGRRTSRPSDEGRASSLLASKQLAFTFRVDLPDDLPHTLVATSCRYHYAICLRIEMSGVLSPTWIQVPVTLLTPVATKSAAAARTTTARSLQVMAHSSGLPCHLTATELHKLDGQLTVQRHGAALYRNLSRHHLQRDVQTVTVSDPVTGRTACVLTLSGANALHPGSRLSLKFDFPVRGDSSDGSGWIPCYQVSACLQGQEAALTGTGSRKRARTHLFHAEHEAVDPAATECVCLDLLLPLTAPCCVRTAHVEISVQCLIDIAVGNAAGSGYRNLRLEIPCHVSHGPTAWEQTEGDEDADAGAVDPFEELFEAAERKSDDPSDPRSFESRDIREELKILSLSMAERCGLRPTPPPPEE